MTTDPTKRFTDRVAHYVRHRPGYPDELVALLEHEIGLAPGQAIADIGSGTGISTDLFLRHGYAVFAVEPNAAMREAAEAQLAGTPGFHSVDGTAEATTLPDGSIDAVIAGQAFHWFDPPRAAAEFRRILKPGGWVVLFWNERRVDSTPFLAAYEALLVHFGTDYLQVRNSHAHGPTLAQFFTNGYEVRHLATEQVLDLEGLQGRLLSSSYVPAEGQPDYLPMLAELERIFGAYEEGGRVRMGYDTEVFFGRLP